MLSGHYLEEIGRTPLLTADEELKLAERARAGCEEARNRLISANLRLVVHIAGEFARGGVPLDELVSEGNLGLIKAVGKFCPQKGCRLGSYAGWWIRQTMSRAVAGQRGTISLTPAIMLKLRRLRAVAGGMVEVLGREPNNDELAEELGIDTGSVERLKNIGVRPASMDAEISDERGMTLGSLLVDHEAEDPYEVLSGKDLETAVRHLLVFLNDKEKLIIIRRFGLDGNPASTLEELGVQLGCTRERVRQIQKAALKRMRQAFARRQVGSFLKVVDGSPQAPALPVRTRTPVRAAA